jgi:Protein tyrosine and serine/threonine kinase
MNSYYSRAGILRLVSSTDSSVECTNPDDHGLQNLPYSRSRDFLRLLALVQTLPTVEIAPFTWQRAREAFASGGTSIINESFIKDNCSFAFKCASEEAKQNPQKVFQSIIDEISVLGQPALQQQDHIVQLQGICWDIVSSTVIWPVLIFEKIQLGDLWTFAESIEGRKLDLRSRMTICCDLGTALLYLHGKGKEYSPIKKKKRVLTVSFQILSMATSNRITYL